MKLNQKISDFYNIKKKNVMIETFLILNNKIFIFLKNSYILNFEIEWKINEIDKLPSKINSNPIIIDKSLFLFR